MLTNDVIREARTGREIFFLLNAHVESVKFGDKLGLLPEHMTRLPLTDVNDLKDRFSRLTIELDSASKGLSYKTCTAIKETLQVFGAGIARLQFIEDVHNLSLAQAARALDQNKTSPAFPSTPEQKPSVRSDQVQQ